MASYRPFPPQTSYGPPANQNPLPAPAAPHPPQPRGNQYNQNWGYGGGAPAPPPVGGGDGSAPPAPSSSFTQQNYNQMRPNSNYHSGYGSASSQPHYGPPRAQHPPPPPAQQYSYPPPPPPESSYQPPPPPPSVSQNSVSLQPPQQPPMYYPSSKYNQYNSQAMQPPPPPPPSSPPNSSAPPPPPPGSPPPPPSSAPPESRSRDSHSGMNRKPHGHDKGKERDLSKQQKPPVPHVKKSNGPPGRVETEEERRMRKKREFDKQRQEEKHRHQLKESQNTVLQKTQMLASGKGHGSIVGSRMGERRSTPFLSGERIENRLKKPTTFLCKLKFRNELPDPSAQPKLMTVKRDKDRFSRYTITSLEKSYKPELHVETDLGIPLDLLDLSVYNPPKERPPLEPEDEELLRDDESITPVKKDGIKRKDRPTDKGVAWLVKTQYISPLSMESTKQSLTEKQAKELRESKGGRNILSNLNNRERHIKEIEASFEAAKLPPKHATNKDLYPVEVLPLLPDFDRYDDQFVVAQFDNFPTADSEFYGKLDASERDAHESKAVMRSYMAASSDPAEPEKFLAYMVPSAHELSKDIYDENEDTSYTWIREYHWDVRGDDADDPATYLVSFGEDEARYLPLPTKLNLRKKRARDGRAGDEIEHFPAPSSVTVRRRSAVAAIELKDPEVYSNSKGKGSMSEAGGSDIEEGFGRRQHGGRHHEDMDQYSGGDDDMSD